MKRIGIWVMICGCMSILMWLGSQAGPTPSIAAEDPVGKCWNPNEGQLVQKDVRPGQRCKGPGSHCVSDDDCAYIAANRFRTTIARTKTSNCEDAEETMDCAECPEGSAIICAQYRQYRQKDIETGECSDLIGTMVIWLGKCEIVPVLLASY